MDDYAGENRRKNGGLSDEQVEAVKNAILESIYKEIGRSVVKWGLWVGGSILLALGGWLAGAGHIFKIPGSTE
jgi:hypothetical protein